MFGEAPYQYRFTYDGEVIQEFFDSNTLVLKDEMTTYYCRGSNTVIVEVRDTAFPDEISRETLTFEMTDTIIG